MSTGNKEDEENEHNEASPTSPHEEVKDGQTMLIAPVDYEPIYSFKTKQSSTRVSKDTKRNGPDRSGSNSRGKTQSRGKSRHSRHLRHSHKPKPKEHSIKKNLDKAPSGQSIRAKTLEHFRSKNKNKNIRTTAMNSGQLPPPPKDSVKLDQHGPPPTPKSPSNRTQPKSPGHAGEGNNNNQQDFPTAVIAPDDYVRIYKAGQE